MHYGALPKKTSIKGQPHELSYITPQEAGVLRMLGGAGKNVNGVPAYYHTPGHAGYTSNRYDTIDYGGGDSLGEGQDTITASTYFKNDKDDNVKEETPKSFFNFNKQENENFLTSLALNFKWAKDMNEEYQRATNPNYVDPNAITQTNIGSTGQVGDLSEEQTRLLGDTTETFVNPNTMVMEKYGKILMSTPDGTGNFINEYYDNAEEFEALNPGFDAPTSGNVGIYDSNDLNANEARITRPVDTTGFIEDVAAAKSDLFGLFSGDPLGNQEQNYFVPGYGDVMATSAADAFEKAQFFKRNPELAINYAKGLGAPDFVTGDTDGDGIMDTYSGGGDVRVGDAITDPSLYANPAQADKFDSFGNVYSDDYFAGSGSDDNFQLPTDEAYINAANYDDEDYFDLFGGDENFTVGGFEIPFSDDIYDIFTEDDNGGGSGGSGGDNGGERSSKQNLFNKVFGQISKFGRGGGNHYTLRRFGLGGARIELQGYLDESGENYVLSDNTIIPVEEAERMFNIAPMDTEILQTSIPYYPRNAYDFQTPTMTEEQYNFSSPSNVPQNLTSNTATLNNTVFK